MYTKNMDKGQLCPDINKKTIKKILNIMRITTFLLCVGILSVSASVYSQDEKVSIQLKNKSINEVFAAIKAQTSYSFWFDVKEVDAEQRVSLNADNESVRSVLAQTLKTQNLDFAVYGNHIIIAPKGTFGSSVKQGIVITGTVTEQSGEPIPGVNIVVKGTTNGVITDANGKYSISVPSKDAVLIFSFVGFITHEFTVAEQKEINVILVEDTQEIEEVVVVGYGTSSKKKLTTSVGSLKSEGLKELPITNIGDAFAGQMAGILADNGTGSPGATPVIRIRGFGSINAGSEPLYVIDGVMATSSQFAALNPKSIETIDVLKDAAAGAIYGSRAGNGVILVTTKKGKYGDATFSVNATFGLQQLEKKVEVLNSTEWLLLVKEAYSNDGKDLPDFYDREASAFANTNWQDEVFRTSTYQNYQIAASGGNEKLKYYVDANYLDNEGVLLTTYSKTYSSNGSFDLQLKPRLKMGITYMAAHTQERGNNSITGFGHNNGGYGIAGGIIQQSLWMPPIVPVYEDNGDYGQINQKAFKPYFTVGYANPVANLLETEDIYYRNKALARGYLAYEPVDGLTLNASLSVIADAYRREYHVSPFLAGNGSPDANFSNPVYEKMNAGQDNGMYNSYVADFYANYKKTFAEQHSIDVTLGYSLQSQGTKTTIARSSANDRGSTNALNPIPAYSNYYQPSIYGAALVTGGGDFQENSFESIFARVNYSFRDRYIFMGSIRRDGSSKFAPDERFGYFPAVSAAWRMSEEDFIKNLSWINDLKIRTSYGISGNDQFGNYAWNGNVTYNSLYTYGPVDAGAAGSGKALLPSTIENRNLKWETNEQINVGVDVSVMGSRISLTADYFIRNTKNMLLNRSLPLENGISATIFDNIGNMTNKGIELSLNALIIKSKDWSWTTNLNFTKINNKVDKVFTSTGDIRYDADQSGSGFESALRIIEGMPMFQIYTYKVIGNFETQSQLDTYPKPGNATIGDPMIENYKDDDVINTDDLQPMGHALPDFTYGATSTLRYKNFDLSIVIDGSHGASKIITAARQAALMRTAENTLKIFYDDRCRKGETGHYMAYASTGVTGARHWNQSYFVHDASFWRIRNITLGYNLPREISSKIKINDLRITLGVQNVYTFTSYPLFNPQANTKNGAAGSAQFGVDNGMYPLSRIYTVGLNFNF